MRLIVVGAGIAGSSLARVARSRGHEVTLISAGKPDSLAGLCVLRRTYHSTPGERLLFERTLRLYQSWGIELERGATVTSYRAPGSRWDRDWRMINPMSPLVPADVNGWAREARSRSLSVNQESHFADAVVLATGVREPGAVTYGDTWVNDDAAALPAAARVHHIAPYKTMAAGRVGGRARLGSSSAASPEAAAVQAEALLDRAVALGWTQRAGWYRVSGSRVSTARRMYRDSAGAWHFGGFHRTGFALAPALAEQLADEIEGTLGGAERNPKPTGHPAPHDLSGER